MTTKNVSIFEDEKVFANMIMIYEIFIPFKNNLELTNCNSRVLSEYKKLYFQMILQINLFLLW